MINSPEKNDTLSLLESTNRDSNVSTYLADREQIDRLKTQVRILESEKADLQRIMPRLVDAKGEDHTEEFAKIERELNKFKKECEEWTQQHRNLLKKYTDFEQNAMEEIDHRDKQLTNLKKIGFELEDENANLREKLQDADAKIKHMEHSAFGGHEQSLDELHIRDQIRNSIAKIPGLSSGQIAAQFNESFGDLNPDDAEQIAAHIFMILEKLEHNSHANEELRLAIFTFLSQNGFNANEKKFAMFNGVLKEMLQKRQNEIRTANDCLGSKFVGSIGGKEFEACMRQLNQDSLSFSNTLPGGADVALVQQPINTTIFNPDNMPENVTLESVAAFHLAEQTSNIAESCVKLFDRLRGTAEFFLHLLETIGEGSESGLGTELMKKIELLRLDLDKSMGDVRSILVEAKDSEKNARSFLEQTLQQISSMNATMYSTIFNQSKLVDAATSAMEPGIVLKDDEPTSNQVSQKKELVESICVELNKIYDTMSDVCISSKKIKSGKGVGKSSTTTSKKAGSSGGIIKHKNEVKIDKTKNESKIKPPK